jgi:hypothetical protein
VHATEGVRNLEAYLCEYMLNEDKHEGRRPIKGKLWGCSHGLSKAGKEVFEIERDEATKFHTAMHYRSLERKLAMENKEIPEFLKMVSVYLTDENFYKKLVDGSRLKEYYMGEIQKLRAESKTYW